MSDKQEELAPTPTQEELNAIASGKALKPATKAKAEDAAEDSEDAPATKKAAASYSNRQAKAD